MTLYADSDPKVCAWLRNLVCAGRLGGDVLEKRIEETGRDDLANYERVHLFAGIGGWELALQLAGWPVDRHVWTASCPCPPFSAAGRKRCKACGKGRLRFFAEDRWGCGECGWFDSRHLWPELRRLIAECRPATVFGEQVSGSDGVRWLTGVRADLEGMGYTVRAADLCGACVGSPQIRQRLFWMAERQRKRTGPGAEGVEGRSRVGRCGLADGRVAGRLGRASLDGWDERRAESGRSERHAEANHWSAYAVVPRWNPGRKEWDACRVPAERPVFGLADGLPGRLVQPCPERYPVARPEAGRATGLRGFGNAIIPAVAALFVRACNE